MKYYPFLDFLLSFFGMNSHFTVIVENLTKEPKKVTLFGTNEFMDKPKFGIPEGVKVSVRWWGYKRLMKKIATQPFYVKGMTIKSRCYLQLHEIIKVENIDVRTDESVMLPLFPKYYISAYQEENDYAKIYPYGLHFKDMLRMHLNVLPKERVQLTFEKGENNIPTLPK